MTTVASTKVLMWIASARPKTLTATLIPFLAGTALAIGNGATFKGLLFLSAMLGAFCIQIATNLINDAFDVKRGTDTHERLGPQRALHLGYATHDQVFDAGIGFLSLAIVFSMPVILYGGFAILAIILLSISLAYLYTGGPSPLSYNGLGDLFVIIFFGWVSTLAAFWIQSGTLSWSAFLLGTQIGLLATVLIAINNLRDVQTDAKSGRRTLPVRFGAFFGRLEITVLILLPFLLNFLWILRGNYLAAALPWLVFPLALPLIAKIWYTEPSKVFNKYLAQSALLHLTFGLLLTFSFLRIL
jgi:1,4-dihydroxy-2-naphthoate octaprenyltransferase